MRFYHDVVLTFWEWSDDRMVCLKIRLDTGFGYRARPAGNRESGRQPRSLGTEVACRTGIEIRDQSWDDRDQPLHVYGRLTEGGGWLTAEERRWKETRK